MMREEFACGARAERGAAAEYSVREKIFRGSAASEVVTAREVICIMRVSAQLNGLAGRGLFALGRGGGGLIWRNCKSVGCKGGRGGLRGVYMVCVYICWETERRFR